MAKDKTTRARAVRADTDDAKAKALRSFLDDQGRVRRAEDVPRVLSDNHGLDVEVIPTGALSLDVALGAGGIPRGKITELFGPEMSGKTSLALSIAAEAQGMGGTVGFIDAEHAFNPVHGFAMGVDPERFVIYQPSSGEDAIEMVDSMVSSGAFDVVIVDSVAALTPQAEIDGEISDQNMALHARLMSKFMRRIVSPLQQSNTALVLINQLRTMLNSYGAPEKPTGGKAIPFYASVRIDIRSSASQRLGDAKAPYGQTCTATVKKNKVGPPHRVAEYDLIFNQGISAEGSILEVAESCGVLSRPKGSGVYTEVATGVVVGTSKDKAKENLARDPELLERLRDAVKATLRGDSVAVSEAGGGEVTETDLDLVLESEDEMAGFGAG